jgi:DNA modification methylase
MTAIVRTVTAGPYTLYLGDANRILQELPTNIADAGVMDPPYRFKASGGGKFRADREYLDEIEDEGLTEGFSHKILTQARFPSCIVFCHNDQLHDLLPHLAMNYESHVVLEWHKTNPVPFANKHYTADTEFYIHAWSGDAYPRGELPDKRRYWIGPVGKSLYDHPTVKPLDLMKKIIRNTHGETILDPFMGTGTTGVAAILDGRKFIGIEIKEKFFNIAVARCAEAWELRKGMPANG